LNAVSTTVSAFAITNVTSVPDTEVYLGLVTSVDPDKILNALTPLRSAFNPLKAAATV